MDKITHVYHLADIHIRNLQRHKEYREVFSKFIENVKKDDIKSSIIYLGGDIAHTKTELSPELISEISWLFKECADLRPTFVITGNHDCNMNNSSRLDVLTPIIENLNHPNLHYLRDTETVTYKNLKLTTFSILDNKDNWPSGYDVEHGEDEHSIVFFHGPVNKANTDIGYTVNSKSFELDMFDGYDFAMLGDIHKRQVLQDFQEIHMEIDEEDLEKYLKEGWVIEETDYEPTKQIEPEVEKKEPTTFNKFF